MTERFQFPRTFYNLTEVIYFIIIIIIWIINHCLLFASLNIFCLYSIISIVMKNWFSTKPVAY